MKKAIIFGTGISGRSAAELLLKHGVAVSVYCPEGADSTAAVALKESGAVILDGDPVKAAKIFVSQACGDSVAYLSPGIPVSSPEADICRKAGIAITGELETGARFLSSKIIAISGSKGKSSIVKLIADALSMNGRKALPCANYGIALTEIAGMQFKPDTAVAECSSFQLETMGNIFKPETAAILNLYPDHLDRHGTMENYRNIKLAMFRNMEPDKLVLLPAPSEDPYGLLESYRKIYGRDAITFGRGADAQWRWRAGAVENRDGSFRASIGRSYFDHEVHGPAAAAACAILHNEGLSKDAIERAFARYEPLPHRMQFVGIIDGTRFVNDSKSTSFSSLAAAVRMSAPPVYLIAGGRLKGKIEIDVKEIVTFGVKKVYLIGECMDEMSLAWGAELPVERCGTLDKAVSAAHMDASNGGTILLSPGAASFDQFKDYTQRGDTFTNLVRKLKTKRG